MGANPSWTKSRGPLMATWLRLLRVGWDMHNAHTVVDDRGHAISMLQYSPHDLKALLRRGIERWQGRRIVKHLPECGPPPARLAQSENNRQVDSVEVPILWTAAMEKIAKGAKAIK